MFLHKSITHAQRIGFFIPPHLAETWEATVVEGAGPNKRKSGQYQYGCAKAAAAAGLNKRTLKVLFQWIVAHTEADRWMSSLRQAGVGSKTAGRSTETILNLTKVLKAWIRTYNDHHPEKKQLRCAEYFDLTLGEHS